MEEYKYLIRFKPVVAVEKARTTISTLTEKYKNSATVTTDELLVDAIEYKWASKSVRNSVVGEDIACNQLIPCVVSILKLASNIEEEKAKEAL